MAVKRPPPNPDGALGKKSTRELDREIAERLTNKGWTVTHGAGKTQEHLRPPCGGMTGAARPDITAVKIFGNRLKILRINTVTRNLNGTLYAKEMKGYNNIRRLTPNNRSQRFILIDKQR